MTSMVLSLFVIFFGMLVFCLYNKHVMMMLLSLEYMVVGVYILLSMLMLDLSMYICLMYLIFSACEGALGLSILVSMLRVYGSDYFLIMNFI